MYVRCSPPVISYLCLCLCQPASSPATSQPTSTSLLLGQRLSRGYFFCFSHLLSFILFSISSLLSLFLPLSFHLSFCSSICLSTSLLPFVCVTPPVCLPHSVSLSLPLISSNRRWTCCYNATLVPNHKFIQFSPVRFVVLYVTKLHPCC